MHKAVIDTNVFISGILYGGNPQKIISAWLQKDYIFCLSPELKAEIITKLRKKFLLPEKLVLSIEEALDRYSQKYVPEQQVLLCKDPADNFLLELAEEAQTDYIISGDKLVLALKKYKTTHIISPREFLKILSAG